MAADTPRQLVEHKRQLERAEILASVEASLELPMVVLSLLMLVLFVVEYGFDLSPEWRRVIGLVNWLIWTAFVVEYTVKLALADNKLGFLRRNWLMTVAVVLPVLRVFRVMKAARAARSLGALRVVTVGNRTVRQLDVLFRRRHLQYLAALTVAMTMLAAAGVYYLEREAPGANIRSFGAAVWWSSGTLTTVGTDLFPVTPEARVLAVLLMVFGVSVFGYIAGALASLFVHIDRADEAEELKAASNGSDEDLDELIRDLHRLESRIAALRGQV